MSETSTSLSMTETDSDKIIVYIHGMGDDVLETTVNLEFFSNAALILVESSLSKGGGNAQGLLLLCNITKIYRPL